MKKVLLSLVVCFVAGASAAEVIKGMRKSSGYGSAGCGLGSMVFEPNNSINQIFAATTNGTFGQTFAITSGTSNCASDGVAVIEKEKDMFVATNYQQLTREIAQGKGETLVSYAKMVGCEPKAFGKNLQKNYATTYSKISSAEGLASNVEKQISNDPALASACNK